MDCVVLGASFDDTSANQAFREKYDFPFRLLSDWDEQVGVTYEVRDPGTEKVKFAKRIAYLIDPDGVIRKAYEVADVNAFAGQVLADLHEIKG
jgi:peroxiredoxin Q/BCP